MTKKKFWCVLCRKHLPKEAFHPDKFRNTGVSSRCKECKTPYERTRKRDRREYHKRYWQENKEKYAARDKVRYAIKKGKLTRKPCEVCGKEKAYAHHDDYSKPLDVRWLCAVHHSEVHRK